MARTHDRGRQPARDTISGPFKLGCQQRRPSRFKPTKDPAYRGQADEEERACGHTRVVGDLETPAGSSPSGTPPLLDPSLMASPGHVESALA